MRAIATRAVLRRDLIYGGHVLLAALLGSWRIFGATTGASAESGGPFASSPSGRLLALASIVLGVVALLVVAGLSLAEWRDRRVCGLLVLLALAASTRRNFDVFDLVYVAVVAILSVVWFERDRAARASGG